MKKTALLFIVLILSFGLFASSAYGNIRSNINSSNMNVVAVGLNADVYHVSDFMSNETGSVAIAKMFKGDFSDLPNLLMILSRNISSDSDKLADIEAGFGMSYGHYGFACDVDAKTETYAEGSFDLSELKIKPQVKGSLSFIYSRPVYYGKNFTLNAGLTAHVNSLVINDDVDYEGIKNGVENLIHGKAGLGFPVDLQASASFANGINCFVDFDNLLASYNMSSYENSGEIARRALSFGSELKYTEKVQIRTGADYTVGNSWMKADFYTRINDVLSLFDGNFGSSLKKNVDIGVCLDVKGILEFDVGIYGGYFGSSVSLGYNNNRLTLSYGWEEAGELYGMAPVDYMRLGFSLGWKK